MVKEQPEYPIFQGNFPLFIVHVFVFSNYPNSQLVIHSQQDFCSSRSRLLATKRLLRSRRAPSSSTLGVHVGCQRKAGWRSSCWPWAGSIQLQETPSQLSHCARVNEGIFRSGAREGQRKRHHLFPTGRSTMHSRSQCLIPSLCHRICFLKIPAGLQQAMAAVQAVEKCQRVTCNSVRGAKSVPNQHLNTHPLTVKIPQLLSIDFRLFFCSRWLAIAVLIFCIHILNIVENTWGRNGNFKIDWSGTDQMNNQSQYCRRNLNNTIKASYKQRWNKNS